MAINTIRVRLRGILARFTGGDRTGLTVRCDGSCNSVDPHDSHLAPGTVEYLHGYAGMR